MKSFRPNKQNLQKNVIVINLKGMVLGRVCAKISHILRGKHKPIYTPGVDCGDRVIAINSNEIAVTGKKMKDYIFYKHTGYIGNMKKMSLEERMNKDSTEVIRTAVKRMLPRGPLGRAQLRMLQVWSGPEHKFSGVPHKILDNDNLGGF